MQKGLPKKIPGKANRKRTSGSSGQEIFFFFFCLPGYLRNHLPPRIPDPYPDPGTVNF